MARRKPTDRLLKRRSLSVCYWKAPSKHRASVSSRCRSDWGLWGPCDHHTSTVIKSCIWCPKSTSYKKSYWQIWLLFPGKTGFVTTCPNRFILFGGSQWHHWMVCDMYIEKERVIHLFLWLCMPHCKAYCIPRAFLVFWLTSVHCILITGRGKACEQPLLTFSLCMHMCAYLWHSDKAGIGYF